MANHTITLSTVEESLYGKWLEKIGKTDAEVMASLKNTLTTQVVQAVNELGTAKFKGMTVAEKIAFIG
jgi:hypothetical protein